MILPTPPTSREKYLYKDQNKALVYSFGLISFIALVSGMIIFSLSHDFAILYILFALSITAYLGLSYFIGIFSKSFDVYAHNYARDEHSRFKPRVDVYITTCGEPLEVLENTFKYVRMLDWPEGLLHVYVLDDKHSLYVKSLADRFEFNYITRRNLGDLKKAGNIRNAFPQTYGEFILILDADFTPRPDMLTEMIPYFSYNPKIGIVQSPQFFSVDKEMTWIEKGSSYIQELFYRLIQVNRDQWKASICVGTNAVYRRSALEPHGGTYPIEYSEDMHTGWQLTHDGWEVKYIPINLAKGICPDSMLSFFTQQMRWCTGSTSLLFSKKFWKSNLTTMQKLCYASGMFYYIATALSIFLTPIPSLFVVWLHPDKVILYNYLFSLPSLIFSILILAIWGRHRFGLYVLTARQVSYYAHLFALIGKLTKNITPWSPTGAEIKASPKYHQFKNVMFYWVSLATFLGISGAFYRMESILDARLYPLIFLSILHYIVSLSALKDEA